MKLKETQKVYHTSKYPIVLWEMGLDEDYAPFASVDKYNSPEEFHEGFNFFPFLMENGHNPDFVKEMYTVWDEIAQGNRENLNAADAKYWNNKIALLKKKVEKALAAPLQPGQEKFITGYGVEYDPGTLAIIHCTPREWLKLKLLSNEDPNDDE